jgi:hypothetical protein
MQLPFSYFCPFLHYLFPSLWVFSAGTVHCGGAVPAPAPQATSKQASKTSSDPSKKNKKIK